MRAWLAMSLAFVTLHCGGATRTTGQDLCKVGERIECECGRDIVGVRTCEMDGVGYGACICGGGTATTGSGGSSGSSGTGGGGGGAGGSSGTGGGSGVCTSQKFWTGGVSASVDMSPGRECVACHATQAKSKLVVAGTIFQSLHDVDDCNGIDGLASAVAIFDDTNGELVPRLFVSPVGNFYSNRALPARYRVKIISQGKESIMQAPVTNGDCNLCHSADGREGARGRLMRP